MICDRIDLKAIGTWTKGFRPSGITISFGSNLRGGDYYSYLTNVTLPYGTIVGTTTLSSTKCLTGTMVANGVWFSSVVQVLIPYGVTFKVATTLNSKLYPAGVFKIPAEDTFLMDTVQLLDVNNKVIFSVHDIESGETVSFAKPTANLDRLIMYKDGLGVNSDAFVCYSILFKISISATDIAAFNKLHPSDLNPIIIDDGSVQDSRYIIPV
jgi:hypothetical protein